MIYGRCPGLAVRILSMIHRGTPLLTTPNSDPTPEQIARMFTLPTEKGLVPAEGGLLNTWPS
jgi:hypothetical protein